jgi:hypothetical protein
MKSRNSHLPSVTLSSSERQLDLGCLQEITEAVPLVFSSTYCKRMTVKIGSGEQIIEKLKYLSKWHSQKNLEVDREYLAKPITASLKSIPTKSTFVIPVLIANLKERGTNAR